MKVPRQDIPKTALIDDNTMISFIVESFEKVETQGGEGSKLPAGCLMFKTSMRVTEPAKDVDMLVYDNFVIGTEDDPTAELPETWTASRAFGARRLMEFLDAIGVQSDDSDEWEQEAVEQQGQALVIQQTPDKGPRKGQPQNRISKYYPLGGAPTVQTAPKAKAGAKAAAPAKVATPPARAAAPAAAKPAAARPNGHAAPATTAKATAKPTVVSKGQPKLRCVLCNEDVARNEFPAHYQAHLDAGGVEEEAAEE
jgi:hypothetical protein